MSLYEYTILQSCWQSFWHMVLRCMQILNLRQQILLKSRVHIQCYSLSLSTITCSTFWLFISISAHSQPLNLRHTVYIIRPVVLASAGGTPQNKYTICSIFSPKCNTIYKREFHFNHWISFQYLRINIFVMMIFFLL
jgi:hypothetical protein